MSYYKRAFLNRDEGHAFIEARVDDINDRGYLNADLTIGDCNRIATLDFSATGEDPVSLDDVARKAKLLRSVLEHFVTALLVELDTLERDA